MKKTIVSALTTALVVGAASTAFAAANPFSDVPADHWAYDAVTQLADDGIIEGYGDGTYQGQNEITRYEMAQMIAKAMARQDQVNAEQRALIDKLAAEFSDELNNLGVRVATLEKHSDNVKWNGRFRYRLAKVDPDKGSAKDTNQARIDLDPTMDINDHWDAKARISYFKDLSKDDDDADVYVKRMYVQGNYGNVQYNLGKLPYYSEQGMLFDDEFTGAQIVWKNSKLTTMIQGGRYNISDSAKQYQEGPDNTKLVDDITGDYIGLDLRYAASEKFSMNAGYHRLKDDGLKGNFLDFAGGDRRKNSRNDIYDDDVLSIWEVGFEYNFTPKFYLMADYARNTSGGGTNSDYRRAYNAELGYGHTELANRGTYNFYTAYRYLGDFGTLFSPTYNGAMLGTKGWEVGIDFVPMKNVLAKIHYFGGKYINGQDVKQTFGQVEFYF